MDGNREFKRQYANSFFGVYDKSTEEFVGYLVDMTVAGLRLESKTAIETNALFQFCMDLPEEIAGSKEITFCAKSVWCKPVEDREQFISGFEMYDLADSESKKIELLLEGKLFSSVEGAVHVKLSKI